MHSLSVYGYLPADPFFEINFSYVDKTIKLAS